MRALDVANYFIANYGGGTEMTNLKLNKLVYFAQAVSLKQYGVPLFSDEIQAWSYGPVEPEVYHAFQKYGKDVVRHSEGSCETSAQLGKVARKVMETYGELTAFDLVHISHREHGAWKSVYRPNESNAITHDAIQSSDDGAVENVMGGTLTAGIAHVFETWPNALRMLENS
ncbi:Panacea domain-containing protein [Bifidobacterium longum]|uniref:Panacea domain-containing protein n=1 Tax=Bifidobacterium longum TaxID=216816 RepID=UPI0015F6E713|nr:type II toxin-antitoxin system antitoxin SocA domain-containing protein [Bifidobacterium longum]